MRAVGTTRRAVRGAGPSTEKAAPVSEVLARLASGHNVDRGVVASVISHLHAAATARMLSLYTSSHQALVEAGLAWHTAGEDAVPAKHAHVAKQTANAVLAAFAAKGAWAANADDPTRYLLLDCFRVAMATLVRAACPVDQLAHVGLSAVRKLYALSLVGRRTYQYSEALTELVAVAACFAPVELAHTVREPGSVEVRLRALLSLDTGPVPRVLEIQALAVQTALAMPALDPACVHDLYQWPHGPGAWIPKARRAGLDTDADRAACLVERAVFQRWPSGAGEHTYDVWCLKMDTLAQLVYVRTVEVDAFWSRVGRVCASAPAAFGEVHARLVALVRSAPTLLHGPAYARMCTWWRDHAKKEGHAAWVEECMASAAGALPPARSPQVPSPVQAHASRDDPTAAGESGSPHDTLERERGVCASAALSQLRALQRALDAEDMASVAGLNTLASVEPHLDDPRFPPVLLTVVRSLVRYTSAHGVATLPLLEAAIAAAERVAPTHAPLVLATIHALRTVCTCTFEEGVATSYDACEHALERASSMAMLSTGSDEAKYVSDVAFHYGSRLYTATMYAHAARFMRIACAMAEHALALRLDMALRLDLVRKCQVLAGSYQHIADPSLAYATYWRGIRAAHATMQEVGAAADRLPLAQAIDIEGAAAVGVLVRGAHQLAVYTLTSNTRFLEDLDALELPGTAQGAWLEYVALAMEPMVLREETPAALSATLEAALACYPLDRYPLRHARVALQRHLYATLSGQACVIAAPTDGALHDDTGLATLRTSLTATYLLQSALACVCLHPSDPVQGEDAVHALVRACALLDDRTTRATPSKSTTDTPRRSPVRRSARTPARSTRPQRDATAEPVRTPPPARLGKTTTAPTGLAKPSTVPSATLSLLNAMADAMAYLGHDRACLTALETVQTLAHPTTSLYASASAHLAKQWLALGRVDEAAHALAHAPLDAWTCLAHARLELAAGQREAAAERYTQALPLAQAPPPAPAAYWQRVAAKVGAYALQAEAAAVYAALSRAYGRYTETLGALLQSLRIYLRSAMLLTTSPAVDAFGPRTKATPPGPPRHAMLALRCEHWRCTSALHTSYLALSQLYADRGCIPDAAAFAQECLDLGQAHTPLAYAAALAWRADLHAAQGEPDAAHGTLRLATDVLGTLPSRARIYVAVLHAEWGDVPHADAVQVLRAFAQAVGAEVVLPDLCVRLAGAAGNCADTSGRLALWEAERCVVTLAESVQTDALWAMMPETAYTAPSSGTLTRSQAAMSRRLAPLAQKATALFRACLAQCAALGDVRTVRRALQGLAQLALLPISRACTPEDTLRTALLLDAAASTSIRRAALDTAQRKQQPPKVDWYVWPERMADPGHWAASVAADAAAYSNVAPPRLADGWRALSISLSHDERALLLASHTHDTPPRVYTLPLDRQSRREGDEDTASYAHVLEELRRILAASNAGVQHAKDVHALEARKQWWTARRALDAELHTLLCVVQDAWLGAFQGLCTPRTSAPLSVLRTQVRHAFVQALSGQKTLVAIDDEALALLAGVPAGASDEVLEDWAHYVLDASQLGGTPIAQDEVDMDMLCADLRSALEEHHARPHSPRDTHLFLVLDRGLCELPWESMPVLRAHAVSRLPSLAFLPALPAPRTLDGERTSYLLNPGGDLVRSEARFAPALRAHHAWRGTVGRAPVLDEAVQALARTDTFLYFGHAGGEMYIQPIALRTLAQCAAAMLWGCSSGVLRSQGTYDPSGTPYHYMAVECPALVANLWDTTDKELDGVCEAVLERVGLFPGRSAAQPLAEAVAAARGECRLPYLTGAACVVYGAPVVWTRPTRVPPAALSTGK